MEDHTGREIEAGQLATMDSGHAHCDDWDGQIIKRENLLYFKYKDDGDEVEIIEDLCPYIEIVRASE